MSISLIVVTYNSATHLENLLRSIMSQNYSDPLELIIVDNNSEDQSNIRKLTNIYRKMIPLKIFFRKRNYGFASSCNYGYMKSKYKYILFVNPDTYLDLGCIKTITDHATINNSAVTGGKAVSSIRSSIHRTIYHEVSINTLLFEFCNIGKLLKIKTNFYIEQNCNDETDITVDGVGGGFLLVERKVFLKVGMFDHNFFMYLEDVEFCDRTRALGYKITYCPHSVIVHIGGASSNNKYRINEVAWQNSRKYYVSKMKKYNFLTKSCILLIYSIEDIMLNVRKKIL